MGNRNCGGDGDETELPKDDPKYREKDGLSEIETHKNKLESNLKNSTVYRKNNKRD